MAFTTFYYSLDGGDYAAFLKHFTKQAKGDRSALINNKNKNRKGHIIVIDTTADKATTVSGKNVPKMEVISPDEAIRRRAESEIKAEEIKSLHQSTTSQSAPTTRKRRSKLDKKATASSKAKIKRVRDTFDK